MRIALAQTNIIWENKEENLNKATDMVIRAKAESSDIILFPEMSFTGFSMNTKVTSEDYGKTIGIIRTLAADNKIAVGFGWVEKTNEKSKNHYSVVSDKGEVLSDYVKIHPFSYSDEDKYFESGDRVVTFEYKGLTWSTLICYDLRFPEVFQIVSQKADIIAVPANWPKKRDVHWRALLQARAIENQVYILGINCFGNIGGLEYSGYTSAYDYNGDLLSVADFREELVIVDIDDGVKGFREQFPVKKDRKWVLYSEMYGNM